MITRSKSALGIAVALALLAGFVDAVGFIRLGGFFISFMSGNSTRFAVNLSHHELGSVTLPLALICLFVIGVMAAAFIQHYTPRRKSVMVLAFVSLMLFLAAVALTLGVQSAAIVFMTLAMGAENLVLARKGEDVNIGVTYMTGTLVRLGQRLAGIMLGEPKNAWLPYLIMWVALVSGAVAGAFVYALIGLGSLWIAAGFSLLILIAAFMSVKED